MEAYLGEIRTFAFGVIPNGWLPCDGRSMPLTTNVALYSLLGVMYGGDGKTTFNLPNLNGKTIVGYGPYARSGTNYACGSTGGAEGVSLTLQTMPPHTHDVNAVPNYQVAVPGTNYIGNPTVPVDASQTNKNTVTAAFYTPTLTSNNVALPSNTITPTGGGAAHENRQPYMVLNFCICISGVYPPRD